MFIYPGANEKRNCLVKLTTVLYLNIENVFQSFLDLCVVKWPPRLNKFLPSINILTIKVNNIRTSCVHVYH